MLERWATAALLHVFVAGLASGALAQAKHFDIAVQENATDGRPSVHGFNFNTGAALRFMTDLRVFNESFGVSGNSFFTDAPGFVSRISSAELDPVGLLSVPPGQPLRADRGLGFIDHFLSVKHLGWVYMIR